MWEYLEAKGMNTEDEVVVAHVERIGPAVYGPSLSCWIGGGLF